jgi:hypothetical protein
MHPFVSSFIGEIQRLGASLPAQYRDPAFVGAALLGGLTAYDLARGLGAHTYISPKEIEGKKGESVDAKVAAAELLKDKVFEKPVMVVTSPEDVEVMLKDSAINFMNRGAIRTAALRAVEHHTNAFALKGKERLYLILPPHVNPRALEHEIGHLLDNAPPAGMFMRLLGTLFKPAHEHVVMQPERKAWEAAEPSKLQEKALGTYESGFHRKRAILAGQLSAMLLSQLAGGKA